MKSYREAWADAYDVAIDSGHGDHDAQEMADFKCADHMGDMADAAEYQLEDR